MLTDIHHDLVRLMSDRVVVAVESVTPTGHFGQGPGPGTVSASFFLRNGYSSVSRNRNNLFRGLGLGLELGLGLAIVI